MSTTYSITIRFKNLEAHLIVQTWINCNVKVNGSPLNLISRLLSSSRKTDTVIETDFHILECIVSGSRKTLYPGGII